MLDSTITVLQMKRGVKLYQEAGYKFCFSQIQNYAHNSNTKVDPVANQRESFFTFATIQEARQVFLTNMPHY